MTLAEAKMKRRVSRQAATRRRILKAQSMLANDYLEHLKKEIRARRSKRSNPMFVTGPEHYVRSSGGGNGWSVIRRFGHGGKCSCGKPARMAFYRQDNKTGRVSEYPGMYCSIKCADKTLGRLGPTPTRLG